MRLCGGILLAFGIAAYVMSVATSDLVIPDETSRPEATLLVKDRLAEALAQRRALFASGQTLRAAAVDFQATTGVVVLLDRRVDPTTVIDVSTGYVTVRQTLGALAKCVPEAAVSIGDHYALIGPIDAAGRLRTLTEIHREAIASLRRKLDADVYRALIESRPGSWPDLAEPRRLVVDAAESAKLTVANPDEIPHDLWAAARLPELTFTDFATLVLNQFDLSFELAADGVVTIVPVPDSVVIEQRHRIAVRDKDDVAERWRAAFPDLPVSWKGATAVVSATVETHERLDELIRGEQPMKVDAAAISDRLFTMTAPEGTAVGTLIASLRAQGTPIRFEGISGAELEPLLKQTVEFEVERVSAREFFQKALGGLGAMIDIRDEEVVLRFSSE